MTPETNPNQPPSNSGPLHVGLIMDGNGRWAQQRGLPRNEGHRQGVENVRRIVRIAGDYGIKYLTLYAFSRENWSRPADEVGALMRLLEFFLRQQLKELHKNRIKLRTIGRIDELPPGIAKLLHEVERETATYDNWTLVLALNYGSRTEVLDAVEAWHKAVTAGTECATGLDWPQFSRYLYTADMPDPDLIIRTSGESRVSNFLLMQAAYAEFYFTPKYWPDFAPEDFAAALEWYRKRERRFGKTGEQIRQSTSCQGGSL
ncbi:MAG: polyprenyl diphosphate synthase [Verrucomicrobiota bacterium]|nr:polyprenyl diphosphate synthase [Verrucomicrobiota bacterium]